MTNVKTDKYYGFGICSLWVVKVFMLLWQRILPKAALIVTALFTFFQSFDFEAAMPSLN